MIQQHATHTSPKRHTYQNRRLHEWIALGRASGRIKNVNTVLLAYCMDERDAVAWIADVVTGKTNEADALVFMERALKIAH